MIIRCYSLILAAILMSLILTNGLQAFAGDLPEHKITVQQKKIGLRDALTSLLEETDLKFKLSNNVTNDKTVKIEVTDAKWDEVFKFLIQEGGLNYRITAKKVILVSP